MDRILSLIEYYGYLVILFGVMLESTGVPLPGETILLASGILVHRGTLDLGDVIFFGILGAVVGDQIGYWIGREGGLPLATCTATREGSRMTCCSLRMSEKPKMETTMNRSDPSETRAWVLIPAAHSNRSRSKPTRAPKTAATSKRKTSAQERT